LLQTGEQVDRAIVKLRMADEDSFNLVVKWISDSLADQTLTNESMFDTNKQFHGQGRAACMRELMLVLEDR
jgi:hypothetical protein